MWKRFSAPVLALPLLVPLACQNAEAPKSPAPIALAPDVPAQQAPPRQAPPRKSATPETQSPPSRPWPPTPPEGVVTDFCIEVVNALEEDACYVLPDRPTTELLLYLHGTIPPTKNSPQKTNVETVVANAARRASIAALIPRGRRGLAPKSQKGWWGWPTTADEYTRFAPELVQGFISKREKLEALTGTRFSRLYVAGSSSGAYFTVALALNDGIAADAFAALSGGAFPPREQLARLQPRPFYIGYGSYDTVGSDARVLANRLRSAAWPTKLSVHPLPHGAKEIYLDEAVAFFREHLPH